MYKSPKIGISLLVMILVIFLFSSDSSAISRTARTYNMMEFSFSSANAVGNYEKIGFGDFRIPSDANFDLSASDTYDNSLSFAVKYGQLSNDKMLYQLGFTYTNVKVSNYINSLIVGDISDIKFRLYEIAFDWNYYFSSPVNSSFAPFAGIGINGGIYNASLKGFESQTDFSYNLGINFGADIRVWESADKFSSLALASVNQYQFLGSDSRPKYLTIGAGVKYFFNQ